MLWLLLLIYLLLKLRVIIFGDKRLFFMATLLCHSLLLHTIEGLLLKRMLMLYLKVAGFMQLLKIYFFSQNNLN